MQKILRVVLVVATFSTLNFSQSVPEPIRYEYHFTGTVIDDVSVPMTGMFVCFWPAERPLGGRIFCAKTDPKGNYDLTVHDTPDKYALIASTLGANSFLLRKGVINRSKGSDTMVLGPQDESRKIDFQMDPLKPTDLPPDATCSGPASNGIRLCTTDDLISGLSGSNISIHFLIRNSTDKSVVLDRRTTKSTTAIFNLNGDAQLTRCESIFKEARAGQMTRSQIECLPIGGGPSTITYLPNHDTKGEISLTADRPPLEKGRYVVYLFLTLKSTDGITDDKLSLGPISSRSIK